jgi:hypothetical protein
MFLQTYKYYSEIKMMLKKRPVNQARILIKFTGVTFAVFLHSLTVVKTD